MAKFLVTTCHTKSTIIKITSHTIIIHWIVCNIRNQFCDSVYATTYYCMWSVESENHCKNRWNLPSVNEVKILYASVFIINAKRQILIWCWIRIRSQVTILIVFYKFSTRLNNKGIVKVKIHVFYCRKTRCDLKS